MSFDCRTHVLEGASYREALLPRLAPFPADPEDKDEEEEEEVQGLSWITRHSIEYQGQAGHVEEFLEPALEEWRLVERRIPPWATSFSRAAMVRVCKTLDTARARLVRWSCRSRDTGVAEPPRRIQQTVGGRDGFGAGPPRSGGRGSSDGGASTSSGGGRSREQPASPIPHIGSSPRHSMSEVPFMGGRILRSDDSGGSGSIPDYSSSGRPQSQSLGALWSTRRAGRVLLLRRPGLVQPSTTGPMLLVAVF